MTGDLDPKCGWKARAEDLSTSLVTVAQERDAAKAEAARLRKEFVAFLGVSRCSNGCHPDDMTCATSRADAAIAATDSGEWLQQRINAETAPLRTRIAELEAEQEKFDARKWLVESQQADSRHLRAQVESLKSEVGSLPAAVEAQAESIRSYAAQVESLRAQVVAATNDAARAELRAKELKAALDFAAEFLPQHHDLEDPDDHEAFGRLSRTIALLTATPDSDARLREVIQRALELGFDRGVASERDGDCSADIRDDVNEVLRGGA